MLTKTDVEKTVGIAEEMAVAGPPAEVSLPALPSEETPQRRTPLEILGGLARGIGQIRLKEPAPQKPPKSASKVHERPKKGFD